MTMPRIQLLLMCCIVSAGCAPDNEIADDDVIINDAVIDAGIFNDDLVLELPIEFTRDAVDTQPDQTEIDQFTNDLVAFWKSSDYFDWLLRMSHGMHADTGLPDYALWWTDTHAEKTDGGVTIVHDWSEEHGGHNILRSNSNILATATSGYLLTNDHTLGELTRLYCRGISQTMLGVVHDENDPVKHIMARNVVASSHSYTTHDGRRKTVDYSNWFFPYDRWNCSRFLYTDNPYWGEVWVTNTRSKDGLGYLNMAAVNAMYAAYRAPDPAVREACLETLELLTDFSSDIAKHGFNIRTKDADGNVFILDETTMFDPSKGGDLASYTFWDGIFPQAECNNTLATVLLAYGDTQDIDCSPSGGHPDYEMFSMMNNAPNGHIMRSFHISAIKWALARGKNEVAVKSLRGLEERFKRDREMDLKDITSNTDCWHRDLATNLLQAAAAGYPLSVEEAGEIRKYIGRGIQEYQDYPAWDLWSESSGDGEIQWLPSSSKKGEDDQPICWTGPGDMGLALEYCWSPFRNPAGIAPVNCDIIRQTRLHEDQ